MAIENNQHRQDFYCFSGRNDCAREQELAQLYEELQASHRELEGKARALEESQQQLRLAMARQEQVNAELREIDRMKSDFIGIVSHELTTPLTFLLGALEFLEESLPGRISEDEQSLFDYAKQGSQRLADIVDNMLDIVRLDADSFHPQRELVSLFPILTHIHGNLASVIAERSLALDLGDSRQWPELSVDPAMVHKVLEDLLGNAVKYTKAGGSISLSGHLRSRDSLAVDAEQIRLFYPEFPGGIDWAGDFFEVRVTDSGIGIPRQELPHIFERFYTVGKLDEHSSGDKFLGKGAGLGLALVKRIVQGHGGVCWAASRGTSEETGVETPGCSIHLLFPCQPKTRPVAAPPENARKSRLLVIDDETDTRQFVEVLLKQDYDLEVAENGREGLEKARKFKPDLILLDLLMPEMDGFEVCEKLKADPQTAMIPVVIFTALSRKHERVRGKAVGAVDFIAKPFFPRELLQQIEQLLSDYCYSQKEMSGD